MHQQKMHRNKRTARRIAGISTYPAHHRGSPTPITVAEVR